MDSGAEGEIGTLEMNPEARKTEAPESNKAKRLSYTCGITVIVLGLYLSSHYSYLLFHSLIEITSIAIGFTLFILTWNARRFLANDCLKLLGIGYAFIAFIDLLHTLAYKGMSVFPGYGANLPTQLWIAARALQAVTLCAAPSFVERRVDNRAIFVVYTLIVSGLVAMVYSGNFPDCYIEGRGLTTFKIGSEYVITALLLASLYLFYRNRRRFDDRVFFLTFSSITCTAVSEISFTAYLSVYGYANMVGHFFKLAAFYLIYRAILVTGLREPFDLIFRELKKTEESLQKAHDNLDEKVSKRTAELKAANEELKKSEARFRRLAENARDVIYRMSLPDGSYEYVSPAASEIFGYAPEEFYDMPQLILNVIPPDWHGYFEEQWSRLLRGDMPPTYEFPIVHKSGDVRWVNQRNILIRDDWGRVTAIEGIVSDITERKRDEEYLAERVMLAELSADIGYSLTKQGDLRSILNECAEALVRHLDVAFARIWTLNAAEDVLELQASAGMYTRLDGSHSRVPVGKFKIGLIAEQRRPHITNTVIGDPLVHDQEWAAREGMVAFAGHPLTIDDRLVGIMAMFSRKQLADATLKALASVSSEIAIGIERKLGEEALKRSEERYRLIVDTANEGIWMLGEDLTTTFVNARMAEMIGCRTEEMIGHPMTAFLFDEDASDHHRRMENRRRGQSEHYECRFRRTDGQTVWTLVSAVPIFDAGHDFRGTFAMHTDITKRKQVEEELRVREAFIRNILESVDEGFIVVDRDFRILSANKAFCDNVTYREEEVIGRTCYEISHRIDKPCFKSGEECAVKRTVETGKHHTVLHTHVSSEGVKQHVELKSYPITDSLGNVTSVIETINDVTEKKKLEEQLRHAQKLEALGTLAGGVAHDFNNVLTAIVGYAGIMEMRMLEDDPYLPYVREIMHASDRASQLTRALLIFSRKQPAELKPLNVNYVIDGMKKMILRLISEEIEIGFNLSPERLVIMGDPGQIEQVLMNFVTNARDAMPDGGSLTIETRPHEIDDDFIHMHGFGSPGEYALISVSDTGEGMDAKTRERIFEPFFTTKGPGKGTGLGLSIVYGIVKQHNGYVNCYSEPGKGTTFKVYFPIVREESLEEYEKEHVPVQGGSETILIADDDETVRRLTRELLEKYGYTVMEAVNGEDAVKKFLDNRDRIHLVLLDVIMPRKSGKGVFEEIRYVQPDVKTLFISGYTEEVIERKKILEEGLEMLLKPVRPRELLARIRKVLDTRK